MEVYKDISSSQSQKFKKLLIDNFSKTKIEEGKLLTGTITKITEKQIYLMIDGMKSEALIDINEAKSIYNEKKINNGIHYRFLNRLTKTILKSKRAILNFKS